MGLEDRVSEAEAVSKTAEERASEIAARFYYTPIYEKAVQEAIAAAIREAEEAARNIALTERFGRTKNAEQCPYCLRLDPSAAVQRAVAEEREACARVAEVLGDCERFGSAWLGSTEIARAIRSGGKA